MSYDFECPECGQNQYEVLGAFADGTSEDLDAHCWACDYSGEIGEAPDYDSEAGPF